MVNSMDIGDLCTALLNILRDVILCTLKAKSCRKDINRWMAVVAGKGFSNHKVTSLRSATIHLSGADRETLCDLCGERTNCLDFEPKTGSFKKSGVLFLRM